MKKEKGIRPRSCDSHLMAARIGVRSRATPAMTKTHAPQGGGDILTLADPGDILTLV